MLLPLRLLQRVQLVQLVQLVLVLVPPRGVTVAQCAVLPVLLLLPRVQRALVRS